MTATAQATAMQTTVAELEREYLDATLKRAASVLPVGVTREAADQVLRQQRFQLDQLKGTIPSVLAGTASFSAWVQWATAIHDTLAALRGFVGHWSMTSVLSRAAEDFGNALPKPQDVSDWLMWIAIGLGALALLYGASTVRGLAKGVR